MRVQTVASLISLGLLTAACGGGDKPAEAPAAPAPTAAAPAAPEAPVAPVAPAAPASPAETVSLASLTGDVARGEKIFAQCKACHVAEPGVNRVGPSLHAVVGRKSGSVAGFNYSQANRNSGVIWNEEVLFTYLEAPQKFMPGTRMAFAGLKQPQDRADVIAFLKTKA
ncbi:cytochrome c family protein [Sphingomonas sp. IBVSS1]|uniref:Cytochrome c family protein n=1 Tax=Sandarakinorhabdus cyanobacteriorum TaxID=1981098 RepID=A0A255YPZ6_9SPHN|nr:cytochrome c family protein [Sandarakinorhabdus cyanobacteriorum]OSZ72862.1 cytochrome c family protein [Sphingomonas sp. IBVSS1]OYQ30665.1 cytochrome c family protein [Sandarakinorhabdus cyanobacteriorum]